MLGYQKIDISEGIDKNKTNASKECELCHYWFSKDIGVKFKEHVCDKCHDLLTIAYSLKDIAILNAKGATFRCILMGISKNEGLKRLNNSVTYNRGVMYNLNILISYLSFLIFIVILICHFSFSLSF